MTVLFGQISWINVNDGTFLFTKAKSAGLMLMTGLCSNIKSKSAGLLLKIM